MGWLPGGRELPPGSLFWVRPPVLWLEAASPGSPSPCPPGGGRLFGSTAHSPGSLSVGWRAPLWYARPSARPSTRAAWMGMSPFPSCVREKWPERAPRRVRGPKSGPRGTVGACTTRKRRHCGQPVFGRWAVRCKVGQVGGARVPSVVASDACGSKLPIALSAGSAPGVGRADPVRPSPCRRGGACCRIGRPRGATLRYGAWRCRDTGSRPYRRRSA